MPFSSSSSSSPHTPHAPTHPPTTTLSPSDRSHPGRTASSPSSSPSTSSSSSSAQGREKERKRKKRAPPSPLSRSTLGGEAKEKRRRSRKSKGRALSLPLSLSRFSLLSHMQRAWGERGKGRREERKENPPQLKVARARVNPYVRIYYTVQRRKSLFRQEPILCTYGTYNLHALYLRPDRDCHFPDRSGERKQRGAFSFLPSPSVIRPHQRVISPLSEQIEGGLPSLRPAEKEGKKGHDNNNSAAAAAAAV